MSTTAKVNDYLVGASLDEALEAGHDVLVSWPFADGDIRDWTQAEAIWWAPMCLSVLDAFLPLNYAGNMSFSTDFR